MIGEEATDNGDGVHGDMESIICRHDHTIRQFKPGDIVWLKVRNNCWWPGQVVDGENVRSKTKKNVNDGVLARMYGSYEYLYVDPVKCNTEFDNMLKQENLSDREAFQRTLDEDLSQLRSGGNSKRKTSNSRDIATKDAPKGKKRKQDKAQMETEVTPKHTKKSNAAAEPASNLSERRVRVMQNLGLIAPQGSPYRRNGFVATASVQLFK